MRALESRRLNGIYQPKHARQTVEQEITEIVRANTNEVVEIVEDTEMPAHIVQQMDDEAEVSPRTHLEPTITTSEASNDLHLHVVINDHDYGNSRDST